MSRCRALCCLIALVALAGCGGTADPGLGHGVSLEIDIYDGWPDAKHFTLRCDPPGGSLPFAPRLCDEIHRHPVAMLDPGTTTSTCLGTFGGGVAVSVRGPGSTARHTFGGRPNCDWPAGVALEIYYAAAEHDLRTIDRAARRLGLRRGSGLRPRTPRSR